MSDEQHSDDGCQFPAGPGGLVCGERVARSGAPGRPSRYCANPEHTRAKAFAARRAFERTGAGGPPEHAVQGELGVPERPVTDGRASFGALLSRFEDALRQAQRAGAEQQAQLAVILEHASEVVRTVSDPDAAGYEVEQIQREASVLVAGAQTAQAAAERDAREARKTAEREAELRAQAEEAAEEALRELQAVRADMRSKIEQANAEAEQRVQLAQRAAAEQLAAMRRTVEDAHATLRAVQQEAAEAISARTRAEAEKDAAERAARRDQDSTEQLRKELAELRQQHRDDIAALRAELTHERAAIAAERTTHTEQLAALLATVQQGTGHSTPTNPPPPPSRRSRTTDTDRQA